MLVDFSVAGPTDAEREVAFSMLDEKKIVRRPATIGADNGYDKHDFIAECRAMNVVPHVAQNHESAPGSGIDAGIRHSGYAISQRIRKRVVGIFSRTKTVRGFRRMRFHVEAGQLAA